MEGRKKRRAGQDEAREGPGFWTKVTAVITTLGALVALIAGVKALLPSGSEPPPSGEIRELELEGLVTVSEADERVLDDRSCPGVEHRRRGRVVSLPLVNATVTLAQDRGDFGPGVTGPDPTVKGPGPDENGPGPDEKGPLPGSEEPSTGEEPPVTDQVVPELPERAPAEASDEVEELVAMSGVSEQRLEELLWNPPPGRGSEISRDQLATIIDQSRTRTVRLALTDGDGDGDGAAPEDGGQSGDPVEADEVIGWLFDATTLLKHLEKRCAYLQWSLYDSATRRRVDQAWLIDRRGARYISRGTPDQRTATFWVPAPSEDKPYLLNVALYDADGTQLDIAQHDDVR